MVSSVLHVGREGAFLNIISKTIQKMNIVFNSKNEHIHAYIGPFIKSCCYEIKNNVLEYASIKYPFALVKNNNKYFLDLEKIIINQFIANNISHVKNENTCTSCNTNYFSYRRDGVCGRFCVGVKIL